MSKTSYVALVAALVVILGGFALRSYAADDAAMPQVGQMAPNFTLPNEEGKPVSLDSLRGKWVVLYFYPKDMTSGCTIEAHNFQRDIDKYHADGAVVVGVSVDSVDSHKEFCAKDGLGFTLLSDNKTDVSQQYGVLANYMGMKMDKRTTFLINPEGKIVKVWTGVNPNVHSAEVLTALNDMKQG